MRQRNSWTTGLLATVLGLSLGSSVVILETWTAIAQTTQDRKAEGDRAITQFAFTLVLATPIAEFITVLPTRIVVAGEIPECRFDVESPVNPTNPYNPSTSATSHCETARNEWLLYQGWYESHSGNFSEALKLLERAAKTYQKSGYKKGEGKTLANLGWVYYSLGKYDAAIQAYEYALKIQRQIGDREIWGETFSLGGLGLVYYSLGDYKRAISFYEKALAIARRMNDRLIVAYSLTDLGSAYQALGEYEKAIMFHQQAIAIGSFYYEAYPYIGIGQAYLSTGKMPQAIEAYKRALLITEQKKDLFGKVRVLHGLGRAYQGFKEYENAENYYKNALILAQEIQDLAGAGYSLNYLGDIYAQQKQPELAIVFYKQSVNVRETIRADIRKLSRDIQEAYTQSVAGTYRSLADLLLSQGRVLEAQQVLELLKIQELRDFTRDTRAEGETKGVPLNAPEARVKPPFDTLIALGVKLTNCESQQPRCAERDQLLAQRNIAKDEFEQQADRLRRLARQQTTNDPAQLQQQELTVAAANVVQAQPKTVLIYPLVLEDKLWLVYGVQAGKSGVAFASKEIPVSRKELSETVAQFRTLLENPRSDVQQLQQVSQKLYGWLVAPLRSQLDANDIQTLVFSLDRSTRYMPLAALFDGKQYLTERFTISTILTAGLTNTTDKLSPNPADNPVLGLGLSNPVSGFNPLPNVPAEIDAIVRTKATDTKGIFQGSEYLNQDFTLTAFKDLIDYRILHIATHGKFVSADPEQSFLVLGNGDRLKVPDIRKLSDLGSIHLAVLSACETAKGGQDQEGIEVAGLSYYFLTQNVKSVMASLWLVNDASTSLLMQQFYKQLATGKVTKAEALRQAQLSLLQGKLTAKDAPERADVEVRVEPGSRATEGRSPNFSHPYYWAPFILIGNSL